MNQLHQPQDESVVGQVTLKYEINGHEILLVLKPENAGLCSISIGHDSPAGTSAALIVNGILVERIADLGQRIMFDTLVRSGDMGEIQLSRKKNDECVIKFTIER